MTMAERSLPPSWNGSVVLDIGGDVGALVIGVSPEFAGRELDLTPVGASSPIMHTEVRERRVGGDVRFAAVYASVPAGTYLVEGSTRAVTVEGGHVTETALFEGA